MIKINVNKKKTVEFDVNVSGVQCENLSGRLSLFYEGIIYSFPATIEAGNVIKVVIPPLSEIINNIPDKASGDLKLEVVGNETFMMPWTGSALLEHPMKVEASMRGTKLDEEDKAKVDVNQIREEEEEVEEKKKFDYPPEFFKSMKKLHKSEKEQKEKKQVEKSIKRHKSKLGEALRGNTEKENLGEKLAEALLGEARPPITGGIPATAENIKKLAKSPAKQVSLHHVQVVQGKTKDRVVGNYTIDSINDNVLKKAEKDMKSYPGENSLWLVTEK